jgi:hypothetical protein
MTVLASVPILVVSLPLLPIRGRVDDGTGRESDIWLFFFIKAPFSPLLIIGGTPGRGAKKFSLKCVEETFRSLMDFLG